MRDPLRALDFDLAIAARAREEQRLRMTEAVQAIGDGDEEGGGDGFAAFCVQVLMLLSE